MMTHTTLVEELKKAVEESKGYDVELDFQDTLKADAGKPTTHLLVSFKNEAGNCFIGLSTLLDKLEAVPAKVEGIDLFGSPHNEAIILGHAGEQGFAIKVKLA